MYTDTPNWHSKILTHLQDGHPPIGSPQVSGSTGPDLPQGSAATATVTVVPAEDEPEQEPLTETLEDAPPVDRSRSRSRGSSRQVEEQDPRILLSQLGPLALRTDDSFVTPRNRLRREVLIDPHGLANTGTLVCFLNAMLQMLWSVPALVSRWLATTELNPWAQVLRRHIELEGDRATALTEHAVAYALLRTWAREGIGHDANEAFHYLLHQIPTIAPLFNTRQFEETLLTWMDKNDYHGYLSSFWKAKGVSWEQAVHDGYFIFNDIEPNIRKIKPLDKK